MKGPVDVHDICILSSQYIVIAYFGMLFLFDLSSPSDHLEHLHTLDNIAVNNMTAVAEDKMAVSRSLEKRIEFYHIQHNQIMKSEEDEDIYFGITFPCKIHFGGQNLFVASRTTVLQVNLKGTVLRSYKVQNNWEVERISYDSKSAMLYLCNSTRVFRMTLNGEILAVVRNVPFIYDFALTEQGELHIVCNDGFFLVDMDTGNALKWNNKRNRLFYHKQEKKLFVTEGNAIHIFATAMTKNTTALGTKQQSTTESYFEDKDVKMVQSIAKYDPLDSVGLDPIRGRGLEKSQIIEVSFSAAKNCFWKEIYSLTESEEMSQQHFRKEKEENKLSRYKGSPLYDGTKIVDDIDNIERICVPSSQYAVVLHLGGKMSLFNLATPSEVMKPLHMVEMGMLNAHSVTTVSKNRIALGSKSRIQFYFICDEKLLESTADGIYVKGNLIGLDYVDETFFLFSEEDYDGFRIMQTDLKGHPLRTFNIDELPFYNDPFRIKPCVSFNPITKLIYFTGGSRLYAMTLKADITEIDKMYGVEDITVTGTGDMYLAGRDALYMISIDTEDAVKFEKRHVKLFITHTCIAYEREQKKLYVACEDYINIFTTNQSNEEKMV